MEPTRPITELERAGEGSGRCLALVSTWVVISGEAPPAGVAHSLPPSLSVWRKDAYLSSLLGHHLTVLRLPRGEKENLQNKPNTKLEVIIDLKKGNENDDDCDDYEGTDWWEMLLG